MKSIKCSECGLVNRSDAAACLRCGKTFDERESTTEGVATVPFSDDFSGAIENKASRMKSYWATLLEYRYFVAWGVAVIIIVALLNQTQVVSRWFVPKEIAEILKNLDERTKKDTSPKLLEIRDRVTTLAIDAGRGRQRAIRELVNLDIATAGISVPNPGTRESEERANIAQAWGRQGVMSDGIAYDPGLTVSYRQRKAYIGEYVGDILALVGEPAVQPILDRIKTIHEIQEAGVTTMAADMPRELLIALGRIRSPRALDLLIEYASSQPYGPNNIRAMEALSFYENDDRRLLDIYAMALNEARTPTDPHQTFTGPYVVRVASDGLVRIKSAASLQILISHLDLGFWENGPSYVVKAITRFGKPATQAVIELVKNSSAPQQARQNGVMALGLLKATGTRSDVIALLDSPGLHGAAARALAEWNKPDTIPDLEEAMKRHPEWGSEFEGAIQRIKY